MLAEAARAFSNPDVDVCYGDLCYVRRRDPSAMVRYWRSGDFRPGCFCQRVVPAASHILCAAQDLSTLGRVRSGLYAGRGLRIDAPLSRSASGDAPATSRDRAGQNATGWPDQSPYRSMLVAQNRQILRAFRRHRVPVSPLRLALGKLGSRLKSAPTGSVPPLWERFSTAIVNVRDQARPSATGSASNP